MTLRLFVLFRGSPDQGGERTEVQSIYSVDQEGFYTTMHSDSQFCPGTTQFNIGIVSSLPHACTCIYLVSVGGKIDILELSYLT